MHKWLLLIGAVLMVGCGSGGSRTPTETPKNTVQPVPTPAPNPEPEKAKPCTTTPSTPIRAVRFDPAFYYGHDGDVSPQALSEQLTAKWAQNGVNTVYFMAYSPTYGARYRTSYPSTRVEEWGRLDLLGAMITAAKARGIKVVAWIYDFRNATALEQHPDWASIDSTGKPYGVGDDNYFMTLSSPAAENWYQGFLTDLLTNYPGLSGIDLAEPIVNWWGEDADFSPTMSAAFAQAFPGKGVGSQEWRSFRSGFMSEHVRRSMQTIHSFCKSGEVTMTLSVEEDGKLLPPVILANETGFDLDAILNASDRPDVFNAELIWQQWKTVFAESNVYRFTPAWTRWGTEQTRALVAGRSKVVVHSELTDFGAGTPTRDELKQSLQEALNGGADGLDIYENMQLDAMGAWPEIAEVYRR